MPSSKPPSQLLEAPSPTPAHRSSRLLFSLFFTLSSFAEGGQAVVLLWLTYALTSSAFLIGVMVVLGYLPAAVLGLLFKKFADRGRAGRVARGSNTALSLVSLLLAVQHVSSGNRTALSITVIAVSQVFLSLAKMFNKAALNRLVRGAFGREEARRVLAVSQSASLAGQVFGAGLAGVALAQGWITQGLLCAALAYAASAGALALGTRGYTDPAEPRPDTGERAGDKERPTGRDREAGAGRETGRGRATGGGRAASPIRWSSALVGVLVFSVPSSGALQFLNTILVPLASSVAPGQPSFYALLNIVTIAGGFLAGVLLSTGAVSSRRVLGWALPVTAVLAGALALIDVAYLVAVVAFGLSLAVTCHVICMQVLTNQVPGDHELGQFAVVRNVVASLAKAAFSFAAGTLAGLFGVDAAFVVLACCTALFTVVWLVMRPQWDTPGESGSAGQ